MKTNMKDDKAFHLALSVMTWYDTPYIPLTKEEQQWRDTHTKAQTIRVATKYAGTDPDEMRRKANIQRELSSLRSYVYRHNYYRVTPLMLKKIKRLREIGATWKQIEHASHHTRGTISKYLKDEQTCVG